MKNKITVVSFPVLAGLGGGAKREFFVLQEFLKYIDVELYIPLLGILRSLELAENNEKMLNYITESLNFLENKGMKIPSFIQEIFEDEKKKEKLKAIFMKKKVCHVLGLEKHEMKFIDILLNKNELNPETSFCIYVPHETYDAIFSAYYLSKKNNKHFHILLHEPPYLRIKTFLRFFKYNKLFTLYKLYSGVMLYRIINSSYKSGYLKKILAISIAPIILSGFSSSIKKYKVLKIGNAFNKNLLKYRKFKKDEYMVFFARLTPEKGIFEIPFIVNEIKKNVDDVRIYIIGSFSDVRYKNKFLNLVKKLKLEDNIINLGFLEEKQIYKIVSHAKLLVYPSHVDGFSLVVLDTLALGTSVVAYDIPAIKSVYRDLKPVKIVKEGSIVEMARKAIEVLNQDFYEYKNEHKDIQTENFLKLHSSWKSVALEELRELELI